MGIGITRLAPALGAEISGVDLAGALEDGAIRAIKAAWAEHGVLVIAGQAISDEAHVRFARHFGALEIFRQREDQAPEIFRAANTDAAGAMLPADDEGAKLLRLNWLWHVDTCYRAAPAVGVILHGIEVAGQGGDTIFANQVAAYAALPEAMRKRIDGLVVRHSFEFMVRNQDVPALTPDEIGRLPVADHPLVRQMRDGRRSLFLSPPYMERIRGWSQADSLALIAELTAWATQDPFIYTHRWRPHDVIMWQNLWNMHKVTPYNLTACKRIMHGATILTDD